MSRISDQTWQAYRRRMLQETERFIEWGLRHPELVHWIPYKPVSDGSFPRKVADWFYRVILTDARENRAWRDRLRGRRP